MRNTNCYRPLSLVLLLALVACQSAPVATSTTGTTPAGMAGATVPAGMGTIKGRVQVDASGAGSISADGNYRLAQATAAGGTVVARGDRETREVPVGADGTFSVVVPAGGDYTLEATVPDGRGGVTKVVSPPITVPLAQDPPVVDAASLVTRRTGSIQGLIELKDAKAGDTPEGADVFLSGGTSVVGKAGETGRFALTNVAEGTWNVVVAKPGYKRQVVKGVVVRSGRPALLDAPVVLERETQPQAGVTGSVQSSDGRAIVGATVSLYPKDRKAIASLDAGLDNFTAITNDEGRYEALNLPPGDYTVQVYRPFYQIPARRSVTVVAGVPQDLGVTRLVSTVAYFGKIAGAVVDEGGQPLDGAVVQLDPAVTDSQFTDAAGKFTLDRILPGEYKLSIAAGGFKTVLVPVMVDNKPNFVVTLPAGIRLAKGSARTEPPAIVEVTPVIPLPVPTVAPTPSPTVAPTPSATPRSPLASPATTPSPLSTIRPYKRVSVALGGNVTMGPPTEGDADGPISAAKIGRPSGLYLTQPETLYFIANNRIRKLQDGIVSTVAGSNSGFQDGVGRAARFLYPADLVVDSTNDIYVADDQNHRIRKIDSTGMVSTLAGGEAGLANGPGASARFNRPAGIALDRDGNLLVADTNNHRICRITKAGEVTTYLGATGGGDRDGPRDSARLSFPRGIVFDRSGNLFIADSGNHKIKKLSTDGLVSTLAGAGRGHRDGVGTLAQLDEPRGLDIGPDGHIYAVQLSYLRRISPRGEVTTLAGKGILGWGANPIEKAAFGHLQDILVAADGRIFASDSWNSHIYMVD